MKNKQIIQTILTIASCAGVVATAVFSAKDTEKKIELEKDHKLTKTETAKCYVRTIVSASATIACTITNRKIQKAEAAALTGALAIIAKQKQDYERRTQKKNLDLDEEIKNEQAYDLIHEAPEQTSPNQHLYFEPVTEQWFWSTTEEIQDAIICANREMSTNGSVTFSYWLGCLSDKLKIKPEYASMGWDACIGHDWDGSCFIYVGVIPVLNDQGKEDFRRLSYLFGSGPLDEDEYEKYITEQIRLWKEKMDDPKA